MTSPENIHDVLQKLGREMEVLKKEDLRQQLRTYINHLILHDFDRLVGILYQVDVEEKKLKELLSAEPGKDAATLITDLIIQRQEQKRVSHESHSPPDLSDDEEKW
jgi:hypothetical protein